MDSIQNPLSSLFPKNDPASLSLKEMQEALLLYELSKNSQNIQTTKEKYESKDEYIEIFQQLIQKEEEFQKKTLEEWKATGILIQWKKRKDTSDLDFQPEDCFYCDLQDELPEELETCPACGLERFVCGSFEIPEDDQDWGDVNEDSKLKITLEGWSAEADIESIDDEKIHFVCKSTKNLPPDQNGKFLITQIYTGIGYSRLKDNFERFLNPNAMSKELTSLILGKDLPNIQNPQAIIDTSLLPAFDLNPSQMEAATQALGNSPIHLIVGPPGTGKTKTAVAIIAQLSLYLSSQGSQDKILVCGSSNTAVDDLTIKLQEAGVEEITRMYSVKRENSGKINPKIRDLTLGSKVRALCPQLETIPYKRLPEKSKKIYHKLKRETELKILRSSRIICCTCASAGNVRLKDFTFKNVFIDEAAQCIEPEALLPLTFGAEKVFLAGDHKQLGPVIDCEDVKNAGLGRSLFERLLSKVNHTMLGCQYRMHPLLAEFPSQNFYESKLETHESVPERHAMEAIPPFTEKPLRFSSIKGEEKRAGTSWKNLIEAAAIENFLNELTERGVSAEDIGIITPYSGQKDLLMGNIYKNEAFKKIKIASVDEFQGGEKDYIILSTVRSNKEKRIGFLKDERRLNVSITRARHGLAIFGDINLLMMDDNWRKLTKFCLDKKCLYLKNENLNQTV